MRPEQPSSAPARKVVIKGASVDFYDEGSGGETVLTIHGFPGSARDFRWLSPCLAASMRVVRVDLPGFGGSHAVDVGTQYEQYVRFTESFMDAVGIERCSLIGHSMGGGLAIACAHAFPARVNRLVLLSSVGRRPHRYLRKVPVRPMARFFGPRAVRVWGAPLARWIGRSLGFDRQMPASSLYRALDLAANYSVDRTREAIDTLRIPCMIAFADDDPLVEPEIGSELASVLPAGPRLRFSKGGHAIQSAHAVEIAQAFQAWTAGQLANSRSVQRS